MTNKPQEQYDFGIVREWEENNRIAIIATQGDMSRAAVDTWANLVIDTVQNWSSQEPIFLLHDLSSRYQGLTPYSRERAERTYDALPEGKIGYAAIVIPDGAVNRLVSLFFVRRRKERGINLQERLFTQRAEGLTWLREKLKQHVNA